ncbi:MAG: S1 RNA-binding domain-containing protein, partial [Elusimicrobia bacterium]|nr:S1 RNA-binding domain-containing protein [Elusimicrobiota bacterium]
MSESTKSIMEELYNSTLKSFEEGQIVPGTIVAKNEKEVIVDIGFKSEGFVPVDEFRNPSAIEIGQTIDVLIETIEDEEGRLVLSFSKAEKMKGWQEIADKINEGDAVDGQVVRVVKGGYIADIKGVEAFLPMSLSAFKGVPQGDILSKTWKFVVAKMNKQRRNLILSRREVVQKEHEENRKVLWGQMEKGQRRTGVVKGITDFGAFIDLGGVDGLLHITDMSWSRISHPSEIVSLGQRIEVIVLDFDRENSKVSLGLKQILPNPWSEAADKYPVGTVVKGRVVNIMPYGVFVEIDKGIEGLLHSSEITWQKKMVNPQEMFS